ncbi:tetratricopeptide repeat protein 16 [Pelodytes ibericus]
MAEKETESDPQVVSEVTEEFFPTAVSEEQLQEAQNKSHRRIFGSSEVFLKLNGDQRLLNPSSFNDIVQAKVLEHYECGVKLMSQENWEKSVVSFSKAINLDPEKVDLYVKRAEAFLQLCDFQSALLNLQKACSIAGPRNEYTERLAFTYYLQGQSLFEQECYMEALECFTMASKLQPMNSQYHMPSISCLAALGQHQKCLLLVTKKLEQEERNPDLYVARARLYDHLQKSTLSYKDIQMALSLKPHHTEAQALKEKCIERAERAKVKAVHYAVLGKLQDALSKICIAIENNPSSADYHIFRGTVYKRLKDFSAAVDDFVMAMQLCNADIEEGSPRMEIHSEAEKQLVLTYNDFAVHCYMKGFYQEGAQLLNKALKAERNKKELYVNRGDCFFQLGEISFALADYEQAFELDANDWCVRTRIAKLLDEMGLQANQIRQYQQAEHHFSEAIKKQPWLSQLYLHRARARRCLEKPLEAQEDAIISILLSPYSDEAESTVMNFFPGKTLEEMMNSRAAQTARWAMKKTTADLPVDLADVGYPLKKQGEAPTAKEGLAVCISEEQLIAEMVHSRRKINTEIQAALNRRGHLQPTTPRVNTRPRAKEEPPATNAPYHWKTFRLGLKPPG